MSERFFNASKPDRNAAFSIRNDINIDAEINGDQSSRLYPTPAVLGTAQKVPNPLLEPAPEAKPLEGPTVGRLQDPAHASGQAA